MANGVFNANHVTGIEEYTISRQRGSLGTDFSIVLPKVALRDVPVGSQVTFKEIQGIVTSVESRRGLDGYITVVNGVSKIGELMRKSPIKSLMYMSMTQDEKFDFDVACEFVYDNLDYIPLIKICNSQTFTGGWNVKAVLEDLIIKRGGFGLVCNAYNFWLRQVNASNSSSYIDTAISLVSFLRPIIYTDEEESCIYILDRPVLGGSVRFDSFSEISQKAVYSYESQTKYFQVTGGLGKWDRDKSQVQTEAERETTLKSETYQEKPQLATVNIRGEKGVVNKMGGRTYEFGGIGATTDPVVATYSFWLKEPMREKYTTTETWRLDPFGNFKALLSRRTIGYNITLAAKVLDILEEHEYDFLTEEFDRPRLRSITKTEGKYSWIVASGLVSSRAFSSKVTETSHSFVYSDNGTLLQETVTTSMDCVKLSDGNEYIALDVADQFYTSGGGGETVVIERMVVEEQVTKYRTVTPDLYERATTIRKLGPFARVKGQENYSVQTDLIRGTVPRHPMRYRTMIVYADNIPEGSIGSEADGSTDVPVLSISNPNIIDWGDAEAIYGRLVEMASESNIIERAISIPRHVPIDVGWQIDLPAVVAGKNLNAPAGTWNRGLQAFPEIVPSHWAYVIAWRKTKRASDPVEDTIITVEAR